MGVRVRGVDHSVGRSSQIEGVGAAVEGPVRPVLGVKIIELGVAICEWSRLRW